MPLGIFPSGESLTFGSLMFTADEVGRFDINPPSHPAHLIYVGVVAFIVNSHADLHVCLPALWHIAPASTSTMASSPPTSGPSYPFGLQNSGATYQHAIFERLHHQTSRGVNNWLGQTDHRFPTSDSEDEGEDPAPMLWITWARGRPGLTCQN